MAAFATIRDDGTITPLTFWALRTSFAGSWKSCSHTVSLAVKSCVSPASAAATRLPRAWLCCATESVLASRSRPA